MTRRLEHAVVTSYNRQLFSSAKMVKRYKRMAADGLTFQEQYCLERVPLDKRGSILDIGVGAGRTTGPLSTMFARYSGVDYSHGMIAAAKSKFPGMNLQAMDARELVFPEPFDCVMFSFNGIDCVSYEDRQTILGRIAAVLRVGGFFIYSTHNIEHHRVSVWLNHVLVMEMLQSLPRIRPISRSIVNRLSKFWRQSEHDAGTFAYVNDCGADFSYLLTYVNLGMEFERTLTQHGFRVLTAIGNTKQIEGYGPEDNWVYVAAQRV